MNKFLVILILFNSNWIPQVLSLSIENLKGNLFYKVNVDLLNTINSIFTYLQLDKNFLRDHKHHILLSMHAMMKRVSEKNYQYFKDVQKTAKMQFKREQNESLFDLDKLINILVQEKLTPDNTTMYAVQNNKTGIKLQLTSLEISENSEEAFAFLKEYLNNLDDSYSFDSPLKKIKDEFDKNKENVKRRRRLKIWKASNTPENATNTTNFRRVFQGATVNIHKYPFLASIHVMGKFVCAGSIISKMMIITAATCLQKAYYNKKLLNQEIGEITVRVGSNHTDTLGQVFDVSVIHFHPYYNPVTLNNNLAILKIKKILNLRGKAKLIRRVVYQRIEGDLLPTTKDVVIVGWGDVDSQISNEGEVLSYSHLEMYSLNRCIEIYSSKYVNRKHFCAGSTYKGAGACQRDIGGPALVGSVLVGVVSFSPPVCGTPDAPTVFTNLGYYIEWIDQIVRELPENSSALFGSPNVKSQFKNVIDNIRQIDKKSNPLTSIIPRSQYPKAIEVLTFLLNELISAGQKIDEVFNAEKSDEDSNDNYTTDTDLSNNDPTLPQILRLNRPYGSDNTTVIQLESDIKANEVRKISQENNLTSIYDKIINEAVNQISNLASGDIADKTFFTKRPVFMAIGDLQSYVEPNSNIKITEIHNTTNPNSQRLNTSTQTNYENTNGKILPKRYAIQSQRQHFHGSEVHKIDKIFNPKLVIKSVDEPTISKINADKGNFIISKNTENNISKDFESNSMSDNYETENDEGLSIEISPQRANDIYPPPSKRATQDPLLSPNYKSNYKQTELFFRPKFERDNLMELIFKPRSKKDEEVINTKTFSKPSTNLRIKTLWLSLQNPLPTEKTEDSAMTKNDLGFTSLPNNFWQKNFELSDPSTTQSPIAKITHDSDHSDDLNEYDLLAEETDFDDGRRLLDYINIA